MYQRLFKRGLLAGLDINASSVNLVVLSDKASGYHLEAIATTELGEDVIVAKEINKPNLVIQAIKHCISQTALPITQVAIALDDSLVITKVITIADGLANAEEEAEVVLAAEQIIPFQLSEVLLDYQRLPATHSEPDQNQLFLAVARTKTIELYQQAIAGAGLTLSCIDIESHCLCRACELIAAQLPKATSTASTAIIYVGAKQTLMVVVQQRIPRFIRSEPFGGIDLKNTEADQKNVTLINTERVTVDAKQSINFQDTVLTPFMSQLCDHIHHAWQLYHANYDAKAIDQIVIAGSITNLAMLKAMLNKHFNIPVVIAKPFTEMTIANNLVEHPILERAPAFFLSCGLALRRFT